MRTLAFTLVVALVALSGCAKEAEPPAGISSFSTPQPLPSSVVSTVWGVGGMGSIIATIDGAEWRKVDAPTGSTHLSAVAAGGLMSCVAAGGDQVYLTNDGGLHWRQRDVAGADLSAVSLISYQAWVGGDVGNRPLILSSEDDGRSWQRRYFPAKRSGGPSTVTDLAFADLSHGWATLGLFPATIARTVDGGDTWQTLRPRGVSLLRAVECADSRHAWAAGAAGGNRPVIIATTDGVTWHRQYAGQPGGELTDIAFADALHGWAVGSDSLILTTSDGGRHWRRQNAGVRNWRLAGITFADLKHGWVAMGGYTLLWTADGGAHWRVQALDKSAAVNDLAAGGGQVVGGGLTSASLVSLSPRGSLTRVR